MPQLTGSVAKYPARASFIWYAGLILLGGLILRHPICHGDSERPISLLDAVFTSTSATCVTGLAVRSTEFDFSVYGQLTILALIQLGGIGIMTVTTFVLFHLGSQASLRHRVLVAETLGADASADLRSILMNVVRLTAFCELSGFLCLFARFVFDMPIGKAAWHALFHSVSAYCNAGFSLNDDSLMGYTNDLPVNIIIAALVIVGGIGYPVIFDLKRNWKGDWNDRWHGLHIHTKLMLIGSTFLLVFGSIGFLALEWNVAFADMSIGKKCLAASFHSNSCRTAGFNSIDLTTLSNASIFLSILLMAVGAGPCSTGGGMKVTTAALLAIRAWSTFRGQTRVNIFRRTIPTSAIDRAIATVIIFGLVAGAALTLLMVLEQSGQSHEFLKGQFLEGLFEIVSALGTVGISLGMTGNLTFGGRLIIIALMFLGRLGPITVFAAISRTENEDPVEYPNEEPMSG